MNKSVIWMDELDEGDFLMNIDWENIYHIFHIVMI
jgi:hypothetical protein